MLDKVVSDVLAGINCSWNLQVSDLSKREARLKDVFQKQVATFREAVDSLFGYRVDMATEAQATGSRKGPATTFVLRPRYGDNSRMQLMFRFQNGKMDLLPTEFTQNRMKREVETFIERYDFRNSQKPACVYVLCLRLSPGLH